MLKKKGILEMNKWILCMKTYGIPADNISDISGLDIPNNLYCEIALQEEYVTKTAETQSYNTSEIASTEMLYLTRPDETSLKPKSSPHCII